MTKVERLKKVKEIPAKANKVVVNALKKPKLDLRSKNKKVKKK